MKGVVSTMLLSYIGTERDENTANNERNKDHLMFCPWAEIGIT